MTDLQDRQLALARHYLDVARPGRALETLDGGEVDLEDPGVWSLRAEALYDLDRYDEGARAAREGLARDPDDPGLLDALALCELERGHLAEAERALLAALEDCPEEPVLYSHYALACARGLQFDKAHRLLDEAARLDPESLAVLRARAQVSYLGGHRRRARRDLGALLAAAPDDVAGQVMRANTLVEESDVRRAVRHFERAARLDPSNAEIARVTRYNRALVHPLQWPVYLVHRFGPLKVWLGFLALIVFAEALGLWWLALPVVFAYLFMVVYSWTVAPLARWWMRRRLR